MTHLTIPDALDKRLAVLAKKAHVSKNEYAAQLLEEILEDQEDYLIALERSERLEKGIDKALSLEEVLKELGLEKKDLCCPKKPFQRNDELNHTAVYNIYANFF